MLDKSMASGCFHGMVEAKASRRTGLEEEIDPDEAIAPDTTAGGSSKAYCLILAIELSLAQVTDFFFLCLLTGLTGESGEEVSGAEGEEANAVNEERFRLLGIGELPAVLFIYHNNIINMRE